MPNTHVPSHPRRFLFLLTSSRAQGNTEQLARYAAQFLPTDVEQEWRDLNDYAMPDFVDQRHDADGTYPAPQGAMRELLDATLAATDLVFVTPLYWYSLPAVAKKYLDHWSGWMRVPGYDFKEKMRGRRLWNITVTADEDQSFAKALVESLRFTAGYMDMPWNGSLIGYGNRPGDVMQDQRALAQATHYFA
ncbi:flavodoxin family protein [Undibacterium flavidum]|uniref:NAD(P)H-dependent oxidoreductase n=1 Tax=Undibacterium flavidum TaxID=2762297 RepID=A0ABR6YGW9_9BURK|nr:NAD(P)H-dependent oxidoreductase [Undibacterium flavidum]MBC3875829.1 NAD(P)H-dependent oxidoreductase [Undibacterium flavidum]